MARARLRLEGTTNCIAASLCTVILMVGVQPGQVLAAAEEVLPPLRVAPINQGSFHNPVAVFRNTVYTANVEEADGQPTGMNLRTMIRRGQKQPDGTWAWTAKLIEDRTLDDPWHTIASMAIDKNGYIHIAYNMHNMPWQYSVSVRPDNIEEFEFRGEAVTSEELAAVKYRNQTPFPRLGTAAIPGTGVTYPSFFTDNNGDLYVTYRFALKPKRSWRDRVYGCGVARYDTGNRTWMAIGSPVSISSTDADSGVDYTRQPVVSFCAAPGWWANDVRLWFGPQNRMHAVWSWSDYLTTPDPMTRRELSAYAYSMDGRTFMKNGARQYDLPISFEQSELYVEGEDHFPLTSLTTDAGGNPVIAVQRHGEAFKMVRFDPETSRWTKPEPLPWGASVLINDGQGTLWAFSAGPRIFRSSDAFPFNWREVHVEEGWGHPRVHFARDENAFYLHSLKCAGWTAAADTKSPTKGECFVRILRYTPD